ncbi:hypothetical protein JCM30760_24820 [Thiomicrorhabdus hydrogeniphila]
MDIAHVSANSLVSAAIEQQQVNSQQQASISMFKKAIDNQTQSALALIESIPQITPTTQGLPENLGNNLNTTA